MVMQETINKIKSKINCNLYDYLVREYWKLDKTPELIGLNLGVSASTIRRLMKQYNINLRTNMEIMQRLKRHNTGRIWTSETRLNVSEGVKKSYTIELRNKRSEDDKRIWGNMNREERVKRTRPGIEKIIANAIKRKKGDD